MIKVLNIENLEKMVEEGYIRRHKHPTLDLYIYNYSEKAQYDGVWNNETLQCRGLIMDADYNIVSRPFPKFFNYSQLPWDTIPASDNFTVTEKMDGSLGISYWDGDKLQIATRGSFVSDQAQRANEIFAHKYSHLQKHLDPSFTILFEIIYPENRIVVDYDRMEDLVVLGIISTGSGIEMPYAEVVRLLGQDFSVVKQYDGITDFETLEERPNSEGYVVHYPETGLRFKLKFEEYKRLHKIITGVNAKRVWEFVSQDQPLDELLLRVPDEFTKWIMDTYDQLLLKFERVERNAYKVWREAAKLPDRKTQAAYIIAHKDDAPTNVVFLLLDSKPYEQAIWKLIEPPFERPFKVDIDL